MTIITNIIFHLNSSYHYLHLENISTNLYTMHFVVTIRGFSIYLCSPYCMVHSIMMGNKQRINNSDANISLAYLPHRKTTTIYLLLILYYSLKTRNMICSLEIHVTKISQCFNGFYTLWLPQGQQIKIKQQRIMYHTICTSYYRPFACSAMYRD